jgi:hypothetical protein
MSKQNKLQKHLAAISKGFEDQLIADGIFEFPKVIPAEVTPEQAVKIATITGTNAGEILALNNEVALERLNYKAPAPKKEPATKPGVARSPAISSKRNDDTVVSSWKR